jgi:hypothetical protein
MGMPGKVGALMAAFLHIDEIEIESIRRDYYLVRVRVQNVGNRTVNPGALLARQTVEDGSVRAIEFFHSVALAPNDQTKLSQLLSGTLKSIEFKGYRETDGDIIPITGLIQRTVLSFTEAGETFVKDFLVPVYHTVSARIHQVKVRNPWVKKSQNTETPLHSEEVSL